MPASNNDLLPTTLVFDYDYDHPGSCPKLAIGPEHRPASQDCNCTTALRRFDYENKVISDGVFQLRIICKSPGRVEEAFDMFYRGILKTASSQEPAADIGKLVYELAWHCECKGIRPVARWPIIRQWSLEMDCSWP